LGEVEQSLVLLVLSRFNGEGELTPTADRESLAHVFLALHSFPGVPAAYSNLTSLDGTVNVQPWRASCAQHSLITRVCSMHHQPNGPSQRDS
jgi:hypothetical protein